MKSRFRTIIPLILFLFPVTIGAPQRLEAATAEPTSSAFQWLQMVDAGKFPEAYADAGAVYHDRITYKAYQSKLQLFHDAVGPLVHRNFDTVSQIGSLKDMPPGQYALVRFTSEFKNKKDCVETVYLSLEKGLWRVAGYEISAPAS